MTLGLPKLIWCNSYIVIWTYGMFPFMVVIAYKVFFCVPALMRLYIEIYIFPHEQDIRPYRSLIKSPNFAPLSLKCWLECFICQCQDVNCYKRTFSYDFSLLVLVNLLLLPEEKWSINVERLNLYKSWITSVFLKVLLLVFLLSQFQLSFIKISHCSIAFS